MIIIFRVPNKFLKLFFLFSLFSSELIWEMPPQTSVLSFFKWKFYACCLAHWGIKSGATEGLIQIPLFTEMQKAVNLVNQFVLFFPQSELILGQEGIFVLIWGVLCES